MREIDNEVVGIGRAQDCTSLRGFIHAFEHTGRLGLWLPCGRIIVVSLAIINRKS